MQALRTIFRGGNRETTPLPVAAALEKPKRRFTSIPDHPAYLAPLPDALPFEQKYPEADSERMVALMNEPDFIAYVSTYTLGEQIQDAKKTGLDVSAMEAVFTLGTQVQIAAALARELALAGYDDVDVWRGVIVAHGEVRQPVIPSPKV